MEKSDRRLNNIFLAIGGLLFIIGLSRGTYDLVTYFRNFKTTGEVISIHTASKKGTAYYAPVIRFTANDGKPYTFTADVASNMVPAVGTNKTVVYDPKNPHNAREGGIWFWFLALSLSAMGGIFLLVGRYGKPRRSPSDEAANLATGSVVQTFPPRPDDLVRYVGEARTQGLDDAAIRQILLENGWSAAEIDRALS